MYTHTINKIEGNTAYVTLHKDTGETETYTEQVTVSDAVFATEDTPFIPPVFDLIEHTRPVVINTDIVISFDDESELLSKIQEEIDAIENPQPISPIQPTPEELARNAWLEQWHIYEKANRAMKALSEAGFEPTEEETTRFNALKNWVGQNRKPEYSQFI